LVGPHKAGGLSRAARPAATSSFVDARVSAAVHLAIKAD
jgi:hypothetical protein